MQKANKLLIGVDAITEHWCITEYLFRKFLQLGFPATLIDGRWYAYTENGDNFFKLITGKQAELVFPENGDGLSKKGT